MNRKLTYIGCATLSAVLLVGTYGCNKPTPEQINKGLQIAGKEGTSYGLKLWAKTNPANAKETATALSANVKTVLLPYLSGGKLPSSAEVQGVINSSLFKNVAPNVKDAIILASLALDSLLPVPDANTYLKPEQVAYIKSFLTGVADGCDDFLSDTKAVDKDASIAPHTVWLK